jgi:class 3 adenylate cyclase
VSIASSSPSGPAAAVAAWQAFYAGWVETLAFLFTDIEGSTALLGRVGDGVYAAAPAWLMFVSR